MPLNKQQKKNIVDKLKRNFESNKFLIFLGFNGLSAQSMYKLRSSLKKNKSNLNVVKKTLLKIAAKDEKIDIGPKEDNLFSNIEIAVAFSPEEIEPAKTIYQLKQEGENIKILGGYLKENSGYSFLPQSDIIALAKLPSRKELMGQLVMALSGTANQFVNVLEGNIKGLLRVLNNIKEK